MWWKAPCWKSFPKVYPLVIYLGMYGKCLFSRYMKFLCKDSSVFLDQCPCYTRNDLDNLNEEGLQRSRGKKRKLTKQQSRNRIKNPEWRHDPCWPSAVAWFAKGQHWNCPVAVAGTTCKDVSAIGSRQGHLGPVYTPSCNLDVWTVLGLRRRHGPRMYHAVLQRIAVPFTQPVWERSYTVGVLRTSGASC